MSFENVNGHEEPERELSTTGHHNRRRVDVDHNTAEESPNTKSGVQDSTETKRLYSFECAEREIERRHLEIEEEELELEKKYFEVKLELEECLYGKPSLTPARIEEIATQAKRDARDVMQFTYSLTSRQLPSERIKLFTNLELWELKRFKLGLWNHRIIEGFKVWAKDRQGELLQTHRKFNDIHTDILLEEAARSSLGT